MFKLLKGGYCYGPADLGKKDILVVFDKICKLDDPIAWNLPPDIEVYDCSDKIVCPGFIDQHIHISGGGGEQGPASRIPEIGLTEILAAGVTTVVGLIGADGITRDVEGLLAKARGLEAEGITAYVYTGSYNVPTNSLIGKPIKDLVFIDRVLGIGEIAIADSRSPYPSGELLKELAYEAYVGGLLGGKAGVMHIHVGDGKEGLAPLFKLVEETDFPVEMFIPTHLNRNKSLYHQAVEYLRKGGYIDFTAGETSKTGYSIPDAYKKIIEEGLDTDRVTFSSDGNGSMPAGGGNGGGVGKASWLFDDVRRCILEGHIGIDLAVKAVTCNVAKVLKIYPKKGTLASGSDADILVLNRNDLSIDKLFAMGQLMMDGGKILRKGKHEK